MQQNIQYTYSSDPRSGGNQNQQLHGISQFQQNSYQPTTYSNSNANNFHSSNSATFIPNSVTQTPQRRMGEEKSLVNMLDAYFIDSTTPSTSTSWNNQQPVQMSSIQQSVGSYNQQIPQLKVGDVVNSLFFLCFFLGRISCYSVIFSRNFEFCSSKSAWIFAFERIFQKICSKSR
ncbi:BZIP domain-containing protein [Caenorhabditis elegans]|uniref:BZIP domain-containing protein n=1 Tax=Caenorhabditis elegans TaxID=6239 RepID=H2L0F8_CAEEL|nr:BZIP domain-containing protein [Caenorhabditis elegans]CCD72889.1 BZIP domain-containing protein [Caenorhabditis elegans]|eukprot:NP_001022810.1 GEX Interacting protein [Caenorhabditis elegans]